jgi:hypothetical protein
MAIWIFPLKIVMFHGYVNVYRRVNPPVTEDIPATFYDEGTYTLGGYLHIPPSPLYPQ